MLESEYVLIVDSLRHGELRQQAFAYVIEGSERFIGSVLLRERSAAESRVCARPEETRGGLP